MDSNFKNERRKAIKRISFSSAGLSLSPSVKLNITKNKKNKTNQYEKKDKPFCLQMVF